MAHSTLEYARVKYRKLAKPTGSTPDERKIANFYLREEYSEVKPSSNRQELQNALRYMEHHAAEYEESACQEARDILDNFSFRPTVGHIKKLLKRAVSNHYKAVEEDEEDSMIEAYCLNLFEKDYNIEFLENPGGVLSWNYPLKMIIPTSEKIPLHETVDPESSDPEYSIDDAFRSDRRSNESTIVRSPDATAQGSVGGESQIKNVPCSVSSNTPKEIEPGSSRATFEMDPSVQRGNISVKIQPSTSGARPKQKTEKSSKSKKDSAHIKDSRKREKEVKKMKKVGKLQLPSRRKRTVRVVYARKECFTKLEISRHFSAYSNMAKQAAVARCRNRFPVPVILYKGKYICRSGTLAVRKGVIFGTLTQPSGLVGQEYEGLLSYIWGGFKNLAAKGMTSVVNVANSVKMLLTASMDEIKDRDVKVLKCLEVRYICDLMVENRKIHSGIRVSSSEKINLEKYGIFMNLKMPYPGCEFFKKYHMAGRKAKGLKFDWTSPEVETSIGIIKKDKLPFSDVNWESYMDWDILYQTQVYLRLILHFILEGEGSVLVHCISGWDRTPLFISLLRLTLWADGAIHRSLNHIEITYLTLAYDWYLFGHDLPTRIKRKEEILHFCFNVLPLMSMKHLTPENAFDVQDITESETFEALNELQNHMHDRRNKLNDIKDIVLGYYEEIVKME